MTMSDQMNMLVSIIVPVYNVENFLEQCLKSIENQSYKNWEAWLVDDGSTDTSGKICDDYAEKNSKFHVIHKENGGQSSARNVALDHITGDLVTFLDSDDYFAADVLEKMIQTKVETKSTIVCTGINIFKNGQVVQTSYPNSFDVSGQEAFRRMLICDGLDSNVWAKLYETALWKNMRFPEGCQFEDVPVTYKILLASEKVVHCGEVGYWYRRDNLTSTTQQFSKKRMCYTSFTKDVLLFAQKEYPQYLEEAEHFYRKSLVVNLTALEKHKKRKEKDYDIKVYRRSVRKEAWKNAAAIIHSGFFSSREKMDFVLCLVMLYRPLWQVVHTIRGIK